MHDGQKPIEWLGSSKQDLRDFPIVARQRAGYQLELIQDGEAPFDWKPMESVGPGTREIRIKCQDGAFRVFYVVSRPEAVYVLHAFRKTTEKTEKRDIDLARARYKLLGAC
ncbi:type II toxin-antitoxin system RelE/ParE family toxin [Pseudomonas sp. BW13M1]|uniref:Type II toxin-antitoxin system RelE/ParE family toxin n=1 Tax=Pseudomonas peradeniyensis TaxID=2745488 RepID=A0A923G9S9_9PSED|nr:type II toxin-antitoxin system RelE/ParE family toxin [Pseudomonas peradeniyensis]MBV4505333.1 type II toxin-antitoxin system RelE/ParE family toxin [Pseudomonas peradeniyensis]